MKKIRVVHLITKLELGGAQVNTIYTYEHLDENEFDVYLLSGPGGILTDRIQKKDKLILVKDLTREINPVKDLRAFLQVKKVLKKIKPHIIHTHSSKAGIIGRLAAFSLRRKGIPAAIHSVHGFPFSPFQSSLKRILFKCIEKIARPLTTHFVFVANDDIRIARNKKILKKDNYTLIRSGFPIHKFLTEAKDLKPLRRKYHIPGGNVVCGIIAPFKPQKGLFHLVDIAEQVLQKRDDVIFFIAGDGDLRPQLEAELKKRGIFDRFRLPGFLFAVEEAIDLFNIGVSTALWEGLPQSLVQLRLKEKPLLVSDIPGNREVVRENENGYLLSVSNHEAFAEKILYLIENPGERERLAQAKEDFSAWDADFMVKAQENLYHSILGI